MKINGTTATKEQELKVWEVQLDSARKEHNIKWIEYASEKVNLLKSEAIVERIMEKLKS